MSQAIATRLDELEGVIEHGMQTFVEVGNALREIREQRLYRESHETFETYCDERWGFGRNYANKQIAAAEAATALGTTVPTASAPTSEAQARELVPLKDQPEELAAVWTEVSSNGTPTAARIREAVQQRVALEPKPEPPYSTCPTCGHRVRADRPLNPRSN